MSFAPAPERPPVRLSHYVVHRRTAPRAANDNRHPWRVVNWQWAALAFAPTLTAAMLLSRFF